MIPMGDVVNFNEWRKGHGGGLTALEAAGGLRAHPAGQHQAGEAGSVQRLELAVERLHELVAQRLDQVGMVQPQIETELLAIMGELTMGMVTEAADRAERLEARLAGKG